MSNRSGPLTITMSLRKFCTALPIFAVIGCGIAVSAPLAAVPGIRDGVISNDSSAIVVPDIALTLPGPARFLPENLPVAQPESLAETLGTPALGGSSSTALSGSGIPVRALEAYRRAATLTNQADPGCHIDWALIAAIGRVESDHARFGGNQLNPAGVAQPGIIGIALDGSSGTARITDSDGGALDQDSLYDRAVGPMQFIPTTWRFAGVDANGDGVKNPQDITDAAAATAVYLCSGPGDLTNPADLHAAILRYNHSDSYAALVTGIAATYRLGISALPASNANFANFAAPANPANPATSTSREPGPILTTMLGRSPSSTVDAPTPATKVTAASVQTKAAPNTPVRAATAPTKEAPTTTVPAAQVPTTTVPVAAATSTTVPTTTVPTSTVPTTTVPPAQVPTTTVPVAAAPSTTVPAAPAPVPVPTTTVPCVPPAPAEPTATPGSCLPLPCGAIVDPNAPAPTDPCPTAAGVAAP